MGSTKEMMLEEARECLVSGDMNGLFEIWEKDPETLKVKIERTGETALHMAVANGWQSTAKEIIKWAKLSDVMVKERTVGGDTALHLAAKFGHTYICKLIIAENDGSLIGMPNESGETPLFSAVRHGKTEAFLYLHYLCKDKDRLQEDYIKRRSNGDTILHSAISEQHFDLAYIIINEYPNLVDEVNGDGLSPLHLLATKPSVFPSGVHLSGIRKLAYNYCVRVQKLEDTQLVPFIDPKPQPTWEMKEIEHRYRVNKRKLSNQKNKCNSSIAGGEATSRQVDVDPEENLQRHETATNEQVDSEVDYDDMGCLEITLIGLLALIIWVIYSPLAAIIYSSVWLAKHIFYSKVDEKGWSFKTICFSLFEFTCYAIYYPLAAIFNSSVWLAKHIIGYEEYVRAKNIKKRCIWSVQVMNKLIEKKYAGKVRTCTEAKETNAEEQQGGMQANGTNAEEQQGKKKVESPMLIAAKNGISEMVEAILELSPDAINDVTAEEKNIAMLAVEHRHPHLYDFLISNRIFNKRILAQVDKEGNSLLHIAANLKSGKQYWWRIQGAALHMQMEIKWYKRIKKSMPPRFFGRHNLKGQTAKEIFKESHRHLIEEGRQWLTSTSQSCSVVAALIATVAFATSTTVPGGLNQDNGVPILKHEPVFIISATASLIALSSSMISVVMFLSILTSNFKREDFRKDLPYKLVLGLISLLASIVSMFISFLAGHFFVLIRQVFHQFAPLFYTLLCSPMLIFIIRKFPLSFEIVGTTFSKKPRK